MLSNLTLRIQNYGSYLDSGDINLEGKIILSGVDYKGESNGCGKSTVLKALELFLTDEYKDYTKADIKGLTNANAKRGHYIDITVKCLIDGEPFEANINGKDYFKLTADDYMFNKFRQELTGSIMNQGLVDNIADFEKRSELDNYIDKFYNTKEIVTKLKDLETTTVSLIEKALEESKKVYDSKLEEYAKLDSKISTLKDNISQYSQFEGVDVNLLNSKNLEYSKELEKLNINYWAEKQNCQTNINNIKSQLDKNKDKVTLAKQRDDYIRTQTARMRNSYLDTIEKHIDTQVRFYNNLKLNSRPNEIVSIDDLDKINKLLGNIEYTYGVTYKDVVANLRTKQNEVEKICNVVNTVKVHFLDYIPENYEGYYVAYDENLNFTKKLPEDLTLNFSHITLNKVDTSEYDKQLQDIDVNKLTKDLENWNNYFNQVLQNEVRFTQLSNDIKANNQQIEGYTTLTKLKKELSDCEANLPILNTDKILAEEKVKTFEFRISELHKIIDSACRFSGEELRTEFGTKLARISTILLEDIFGMKGTVSLDSNGTKTSFKFNEGIGDLSFKSLSGGQLQKIKVCINLAMLLFFYKDRQYIFLDEVFQNLDEPSKQRLIQYIVKELKIKNVLLIQHDNLKFEGFRDLIVYRGKDLNSIVKEVE